MMKSNSVSPIPGAWKSIARKKKQGNVRSHGLYALLHHHHQQDTVLQQYDIRFIETRIGRDKGRKYAIIPLQPKQHIERHISIDEIFVYDSHALTPLHLTHNYVVGHFSYVEHAYMMFDKTATGKFDWSIHAVKAHKINNVTGERIYLDTFNDELLREDTVHDAKKIFQTLQHFADQCLFQVGLELGRLEDQVILHSDAFYHPGSQDSRTQILRDLLIEKRELLKKIDLFSDRIINPYRNTAHESPEIVFIEAMIQSLNHYLQKKIHSPERKITATQVTSPQLSIFISNRRSKTRPHVKPVVLSEIRAGLEALLMQIPHCKQQELPSMFEKLLMLELDYEPIKEQDAVIDDLWRQSQVAINQRKAYFVAKIRDIEQLISHLQRTQQNVRDTYAVYLLAINKYMSEDHNPTGGAEPAYCQREIAICESVISIIPLVWEIKQLLFKLKLDDTILPESIQTLKQAVFNKNPMDELRSLEKYSFWLHTGIIGGSLSIIQLLHQYSPAIFSQSDADVTRAYKSILHILIHLLSEPYDKTSTVHKEQIGNYITMIDLLYEISPCFRNEFQTYASVLYPSTIANISIGVMFMAYHRRHIDVCHMLLRCGVSPDSIQYTDTQAQPQSIRDYCIKYPRTGTPDEDKFLAAMGLLTAPSLNEHASFFVKYQWCSLMFASSSIILGVLLLFFSKRDLNNNDAMTNHPLLTP